MVQVAARQSAYDQAALSGLPEVVQESQYSFAETPVVAEMAGETAQRYVTVGSVMGNEADRQYKSFSSNEISVEPDDNEQVSENPFFAPMQNRTGSIESASGLVSTN